MTIQPPDPKVIARAEFRRRFYGLRPWQVHSEILAVAGIAFVVRGLMYVRVTPDAQQLELLQVPLAFAPMPAWGVLFILVGVLALVSTRWPPVSKTWGYAALAGLSAGWATCYLMALFLGAPWTALGGAILWALIAYIWWRVASLVNPDDIALPAPDTKVG